VAGRAKQREEDRLVVEIIAESLERGARDSFGTRAALLGSGSIC
jgi:hypothetical protein